MTKTKPERVLKTYTCKYCGFSGYRSEFRNLKLKYTKCLQCHKNKTLKKYRCNTCGEEKTKRDMRYVDVTVGKCKICFNTSKAAEELEKAKEEKQIAELETVVVKRCQLCKNQKPITEFDILPNCSRDTICKYCRNEVKENEKAKLFKKPICLHCHLPIFHQSNKVGAYHKQCKARRNAEVV